MIKINLVAEGKRPVVARAAKGPAVPLGERDPSQLMLVAGVMVGVAVVAIWWLFLNTQVRRNNKDIAEAQAIVNELQEIIRRVEEFERQEVELEHKIKVITDLKNNQQGPVRIMDEISKAVPELLWLDRFNLTATNVTLSGRAFNTNAAANFIENLDRVPEFQEPVLRDISRAGQLYNWTIVFNFSPEPLRTSAAGDGAGAAGAEE